MNANTLISPVRIVLCFAALALAGWFIVPQLKVDLLPQEKSSALTVSFSLPNSSPDIVEQQVTSVIEGACSQLGQLKKVNSVSNYNQGSVQLLFDKTADMQYKQFELAAIIRQVYPQLPLSTSYPNITAGNSNVKSQSPLLVYSINAPLQPFRIKQEAEDIFRRAFAGMNGIKEISISGVENLQLVISFDKAKCSAWKIEPGKIIERIQSYFSTSYPGIVATKNGEQFSLQIPAPHASVQTIENILLPATNRQPIYIKDIAQVYIEEQEPQSIFRINGNNAVSLGIYSREGENKIVLGEKAKELMKLAQVQLPKDFELVLDYDDTAFLKKEITKNYQRSAMSAFILVLFILLAYRSWRYLLNLFSGLLVNLLLTVIIAWLLKIDIHLYTIAGLAISFGIMIDNAIVMLDYYHQWRNRKVFVALLGATFVTIAALCLVFFLQDEEKRNLTDFSIIIIIALVSSLIVALWFTPALYLTLNTSPGIKVKRVKKWEAGLFNVYYYIISFLARYRKTFITLVILAFGIPVFMLPGKWEGEHWYNKWYNVTIGSEKYQEDIKPTTDKWLGGALRLFVNDVYDRSGYRSPEKTKLYVTAQLPYGNTIDQMNYILGHFEKYLSTVDGVDKYVTSISSGQQGRIEINFKEGYDNSVLPYQLKSRLVAKSLDWGAVEWNIHGVGKGFSNTGREEITGFRITMKGYNYDELANQAGRLAEKLVRHSRIQKVNTNERLDYEEKQSQEYVLTLDEQQMSLRNTNRFEIVNSIHYLSEPTGPSAQITINNQYYAVLVKEKDAESFSHYDLLHHSMQLDSARVVKIADLGTMKFMNTSVSIHKEDRQYIRVVGFDYMGAARFGNKYLEEILKEMKNEMPVGYSAEQQSYVGNEGEVNQKYLLILMLLLAIFFICGILVENLKEPFFIISTIPISFIGLFLIFASGNLYFDQGGYAAFVMLGGLVANAAIFIVNDYNNLRKKRPVLLHNRILIKATANRARTILLTTMSTCCGLIPFLIEGQNEVFWFSLAAGTIGGLVFSIFSAFVALPVLLWKNKLITSSTKQ